MVSEGSVSFFKKKSVCKYIVSSISIEKSSEKYAHSITTLTSLSFQALSLVSVGGVSFLRRDPLLFALIFRCLFGIIIDIFLALEGKLPFSRFLARCQVALPLGAPADAAP